MPTARSVFARSLIPGVVWLSGVSVGGAQVLVSPVNIAEMPHGMRVESIFHGVNVDFDASLEIAGHPSPKNAWAYVLKAGSAGEVVADSVRAVTDSGRVHFRVRIPRIDLDGAAIEFEASDRYRIELDDWHGGDVPVAATYELRTPEVSRGDTVFVDLELASAERGQLFFTTVCQHGYRLRHVESGRVAAWPHICGEALSAIHFEVGEVKKIECRVPTRSSIWREYPWMEDGTLPLGSYELECYVIDYEGWDLRGEFEFEVVR